MKKHYHARTPGSARSSLGMLAGAVAVGWLAALAPIAAEEAADKNHPEAPADAEPPVVLSEDRDELTLPGLKIRVDERYVDVDARVALREGMLELIACAKDTKEHEAIVVVDAKAAHIHAALLLLGAQPGNPAMRKQVGDDESPRWVDLPPRGQEIDVFLALENEDKELQEHPINKFIRMAEHHLEYGNDDQVPEEDRQFPTNTFLFAGSHLFKDGESQPVYLSDQSGNVISLATFGDELLSLPGVHGHDNSGLVWEADPTHLPALGEKVILRLKPRQPVSEVEQMEQN